MKKKTRTHIVRVAIVLFFLIAPPVLFYASGWRITSDFSFKRVGGIFINAGTTGAEIYLDGKLQKRTNILQQGLFVQGLTPEDVSIIVAKEGHWPWTKTLEVKESFVAEARAFLISQDITGTAIREGRYSDIYTVPGKEIILLERKTANGFTYEFFLPRERRLLTVIRGSGSLSSSVPFKTFYMDSDNFYLLFTSKGLRIQFDESAGTLTADLVTTYAVDESLPSLPHKILLDNREQSRVWISRDNTEIRAEWLKNAPLPYYFTEKETSVFRSPNIIRSFYFYPGRRDLVLFAVQGTIFAIELDNRSTRNFQPVYNGRNPYFTIVGNALYIIDGNSLLEAKL
ncbi:MAG: hypothetical protein Q8O83_02860 [bacterium]|nr:hypothetical protein [bacterium]